MMVVTTVITAVIFTSVEAPLRGVVIAVITSVIFTSVALRATGA